MAAPLTTFTATIAKTNETGFQTVEGPGKWLNISRYASPAPAIPPVGTEVEVGIDSAGYVREIRSLPATVPTVPTQPSPDAPQGPHSPAPTRDATITRLAVLKAAACFLTARPDAKAADVLRVAAEWEGWVNR